MVSTKLHLVDSDGLPLASHIVEAVECVEPRISSQFSRLCDPAALSDSLEEAARRIAQYERDHGRLRNTLAFTARTLLNAALSLVRDRSREEFLSPEALTPLMGTSRLGSPETILAKLQAEEVLASMSDRDRRICKLEHQGFAAPEIAALLNMNTNAVLKAKSRRIAKLAESSTANSDSL